MSIKPENITATSKSNFLYSFSLLPKEKNDAIKTIYAFCRYTDDIVDDHKDALKTKEKKLREWNNEFRKSLEKNSNDRLLSSLRYVIERFKIPIVLFNDFIKGMEQDLYIKRYESYDSLKKYCYYAASTVGLMSIEIFGYTSFSAKEFAENLGMALQLTNILRDIKTDALNNRIYIPLEDLKKFNYTEEDILNSNYNESFIKLMKFECDRARIYYNKANESLDRRDTKLLFPALIMQKIYFNILEKIEKVNYDIYKNQIRISKLKKIYYTISVYLRYRVFSL